MQVRRRAGIQSNQRLAVSFEPGALAVPGHTVSAWPGLLARLRHPSRPDLLGIVVLLMVTVAGSWPLIGNGTMIGQDSATQFYPWYSFLGEQLRHGHIPGWNPYQFSGAPFAADPQSGWMYLPAMILFTLLPIAAAAKGFILFHLALAGLATYGLARRLGMNVVGALTAGLGYAFIGPIYGRVVCCPATVEVATWFPAVLLGAEIAIQRTTWRGRATWWGLTGLALSQVFAAWIGQGAYYVLLALASYLIYRMLIAPPPLTQRPLLPERFAHRDGGRLRQFVTLRVVPLTVHGLPMLLFGLALGAAGILPRLEYNAASNVAGGSYSGNGSWAAHVGGISPQMVLEGLLGPSVYYPGGAAIILAFASIVLARRRYHAPFFAVFSLAAMVLAAKTTTPLHLVLYELLPWFKELHRHWPERIAMVAYLGIAMLAGASVSTLSNWRGRPWRLSLLVGLPTLICLIVWATGAHVVGWALTALVLTTGLLAAAAWRPPLRRLVPPVLLVVVCADFLFTGQAIHANGPFGGFHRVDLNHYFAADGAASFLQAQANLEQFRYFGYDPQLETQEKGGQRVLYRYQFNDPRTMALVVNNRGTVFNLQDVQGYNPVQLARYVTFINALNGHPQDYHESNIYGSGLSSPLLDLLNVRYIVVPADTPSNRPDLVALSEDNPAVYADNQAKVLENQHALPRAWIVHEATEVAPGQALSQMESGKIDFAQTAVLEEKAPPLIPATDPTQEMTTITKYEPDRIELTARTDAPAMLMLSEIYTKDWKAYVDGKPTHLYRADDLLRGVALPAGQHTIELRYESRALTIGLVISLFAAALLLLILGATIPRVLRQRRRV